MVYLLIEREAMTSLRSSERRAVGVAARRSGPKRMARRTLPEA
jgi:hypothetical protein